jgi:hypothetical protein
LRKKHRDIIINGIDYAWSVTTDHEGFMIRLFKNGKFLKEVYKYGREEITPSKIKSLIQTGVLQ